MEAFTHINVLLLPINNAWLFVDVYYADMSSHRYMSLQSLPNNVRIIIQQWFDIGSGGANQMTPGLYDEIYKLTKNYDRSSYDVITFGNTGTIKSVSLLTDTKMSDQIKEIPIFIEEDNLISLEEELKAFKDLSEEFSESLNNSDELTESFVLNQTPAEMPNETNELQLHLNMRKQQKILLVTSGSLAGTVGFLGGPILGVVTTLAGGLIGLGISLIKR